ncbi:MAG: hypothetical protein ACTSYZ_12570 [Candidatus Helarchaeota archaeon]
MDDTRQEIKNYAIDKINDLKGSQIYGADLHNEIFNTYYYIIGRYKAKKWLGEDVFDIIEKIKEYEEFNFGEVNTDLTEPEKIVNMYVYIIGEEILQKSETLRDNWDNYLSDEDMDKIIEEIS